MATAHKNRIHVFRAGTHTTAAGEKIEFTQADLAATVAAYKPAIHQAPLVIGHPKMDDPAYGHVAGLELEGEDLYAVPEQVNAEFAEMVNSGAFKNRSLKLYRPTDPANPSPGVWYPQHVGFLGATPPAIKGLKPCQFNDSADLVEVEFGQWEDRTIAGLFRRLRDWFIAEKGQDVADRVIPDWDVTSLVEDAARDAATENAFPSPAFSQASITSKEPTVTPEEAAALQAKNTALEADLKAARDREAAAHASTRRATAVQFCEGLIGEGKLLPAEKDSVVGLLVLAANAQPVEFGEGDGKTTEAPLGRLETLLKSLPKRVEFSEVARPEKTGAAVEFSAPPGLGVDAERLDIHSKALAHQAANPGTDYIAAVKAVS